MHIFYFFIIHQEYSSFNLKAIYSLFIKVFSLASLKYNHSLRSCPSLHKRWTTTYMYKNLDQGVNSILSRLSTCIWVQFGQYILIYSIHVIAQKQGQTAMKWWFNFHGFLSVTVIILSDLFWSREYSIFLNKNKQQQSSKLGHSLARSIGVWRLEQCNVLWSRYFQDHRHSRWQVTNNGLGPSGSHISHYIYLYQNLECYC